jgi:hypothetical protein
MSDETSVPPPPPVPPGSPSPTAGPPPSASALKLLEMALFAAVFVAGGVVAGLAVTGDGGTQPSGAHPIPGPSPTVDVSIPGLGVLPPEVLPPDTGSIPFNEQVQFSGARNEIDPPVGCRAHIEYIWEIDRGLSPPISGRALIHVDGPGVSGDYHRPVQGNEIRLSLDVDISNGAVFEADVVSVGEVPAFPTPLPASFTDAAC